ncbi:sigma-70 family RNA polymerase sigma factor [Solwaraspora sp. WMMD792]|uniref:RNA polymerase sigma factor n=1 Tax=Solwaraspora sp. WMMD792 TaxID=3016099 RepID=UPI002417837C|nr:sigma-70 family RNA polymerase sigma factor [Solwaraspora sp. WMMD792]MDG4772999.1 sigma-70 family RNA polymerase sigma factor [Solwaraspora sp. WMMD792]
MKPTGERDERWFTGVYAAHYRNIVAYGVRRTADMDVSVELAQEVFTVAWRRRADVPDRELPWLYGVARRLLANLWRVQRARPPTTPLAEMSQPDASSWSHPESRAEMVDLRRALLTLPEADQELLRLIGWERLSVAEAASALGCSRTAAAVRLHRARRRLKSAIDSTTGGTAQRNDSVSERGEDARIPASSRTSRAG